VARVHPPLLAAALGGERRTRHFDAIVCGDDVTDGKPAPDSHLRGRRPARVDPADCLVIEDSPTGVAAAEAAGMVVLAVPHAGPDRAGPGRLVRDGPRRALARDLACAARTATVGRRPLTQDRQDGGGTDGEERDAATLGVRVPQRARRVPPARLVRGRGAAGVFDAMREETGRQGLTDVKIVASGCVEACMVGPVVYVAPDDVWYGGVTVEDVEELVRDHLDGGRPDRAAAHRPRGVRALAPRRPRPAAAGRHPPGAAMSAAADPTPTAPHAGVRCSASRRRSARSRCSRRSSSRSGPASRSARRVRRSARSCGVASRSSTSASRSSLGWAVDRVARARVVPALVWLVVTAVTGSGGLLLYVHSPRGARDDLPEVLLRADPGPLNGHDPPERRVPPVHAPGGRRLGSGASA
jgi:(2Fe-2S) ferredoxin